MAKKGNFNMSEQRVYPKGIYFNSPHEKAPQFIVGKISVNVEKFIECIKENKQYINKGYLNLDVLKKKVPDEYGKYNLQIDTWASSGNKEDIPMKEESEEKEIDVEDLSNIPF